jgi:hypothetical protein
MMKIRYLAFIEGRGSLGRGLYEADCRAELSVPGLGMGFCGDFRGNEGFAVAGSGVGIEAGGASMGSTAGAEGGISAALVAETRAELRRARPPRRAARAIATTARLSVTKCRPFDRLDAAEARDLVRAPVLPLRADFFLGVAATFPMIALTLEFLQSGSSLRIRRRGPRRDCSP